MLVGFNKHFQNYLVPVALLLLLTPVLRAQSPPPDPVLPKLPATVTLGSLSQTYDGGPHAATATTVPPGLTVDFTYDGSSTPPTNAGTYTVVATVNDPSFQGTATGSLIVSKATPVITWANPAAITYGTALSGTQLNATSSAAGSFAYSPASGTVLNAGPGQTLTTNFTPTDGANYNSVNGTTVQITVNKATPVITWADPADIIYGTALGATQLNATSSVVGSFAYLPVSGTILNAGPGQSLTANFTPTDATNYNSVNGSTVQITV